MKISIALLVFFSFIFPGDVRVIKLEMKPELFTSDIFDNLYIYGNNKIIKYDKSGNYLSQYSSAEFGRLHALDVSDPFRILLFYKEYNTLVFLDNRMNVLGQPFVLGNSGFPLADAVCFSRLNGFWVLEGHSRKLFLYSFNHQKSIREIDLSRNHSISDFEYLVEHANEIYLLKKNANPLVYSLIGGKMAFLDIHTETGLQFKNEFIYYSDKKHFFIYHTLSGSTDSTIIEGFSKFDQIRAGSQGIYVLHADSITILDKPRGL
jgi:hypothetical protein